MFEIWVAEKALNGDKCERERRWEFQERQKIRAMLKQIRRMEDYSMPLVRKHCTKIDVNKTMSKTPE